MNRKPIEFVSGLTLLVVVALLIGWAFILHFPGVPASLIEWLGRSRDPQRALIFFSGLVSATLLIVVGFGIEIPKLKTYIVVPERVMRYLTGLPIWALLLVWAASLVGFWTVFPSCQPPATVVFEVAGRNQTLQPSDTLIVRPNEAMTVTVQSANPGSTISCSWEYAGPIFDTPGAQRGCQVNIRFGGHPGSGFLTVVASENFCSQTSIFSLQTVVQTQ